MKALRRKFVAHLHKIRNIAMIGGFDDPRFLGNGRVSGASHCQWRRPPDFDYNFCCQLHFLALLDQSLETALTNDATPPARYCIIGTGAGGLTTAKNFRDRGIAFDCLEKNADIGGLWNAAMPGAAVHKTTTMISSKRMSRFNGFPMPPAYPDFPAHTQVLEYFRSYAKEFDLTRDIHVSSPVEKVEPADGGWRVTIAGEKSPRVYKGVVVANGHHSKPHWPDFPGAFGGETIHVRDYSGPQQLEGKRVLVVGGGTSGCDVAVEAAQRATSVVHSMRRGYHIIPKYILGRPSDVLVDRLMKWPLPSAMRDRLCEVLLTALNGSPERYGMLKPDHGLFQSHPTISHLYPYYVAHQKIRTRPNIARLEGNSVIFDDGAREDVDLIVYATGYDMSTPFLDSSLMVPQTSAKKLVMNIFHPDLDNLFFVGLIQVNGGGGWPLMDGQAKLIASYIANNWADGSRKQWLEELKKDSVNAKRRHYVNSERHAIEVRRHEYKRSLARVQSAMDR